MRINHLREIMEEQGLDGFLITNICNIRYITAFTGTSAVVVVLCDRGFLLTDSRYVEQAKNETEGFEIIKCNTSILLEAAKLCKKNKIKVLGFENNSITVKSYEEIGKELEDKVILEGCEDIIESLREVKDEDEISRLKRAAVIADKTFGHLKNIVKPGMSERDIGVELEYFMVKNGSEKVSFDTIVASGERGALPHGVASEKIVKRGEMITFDYGPVKDSYCADITRTIALGPVKGQILEIYEIVKEAQQGAKVNIKAGMSFIGADKIARKIIEEAGYGKYFGHGLGHGTGLCVHERPYLSPRKKGILKPNMVVTIEPGIYVPGLGGVRIEDMAVVKDNGCHALTKSTTELVIID